MAMDRAHSGAVARRLIGVAAALALFAAVAPGAGADTEAQLERAEDRLAEIERRIEAQQGVLNGLSVEAARLVTKMSAAQGRLDIITLELLRLRTALQKARNRYQAIQGRLDERAREAYITGPGSSLEFLLGATSLTDLTDRLEYVDALALTDSDLANDVQNMKNDLADQEARQEELQAEQSAVVGELQAEKAELDAKFAAQQAVLDGIEADRAKAEELVDKLGQKYKRELAAAFGGPVGDGPIRVCPVAQPHAVANDFGAPRVGHLHAGNDIFAPAGTPIYATFDGVASNSSNGLGGNAVIVRGSEGYTYNAHLSSFGQLGSVQTGDVIGYVGTTGNAQGTSPHNHFEWHPNVIPSNWPASPYGYSVLGDAVNPNPLLSLVC